jgi:tetratricopeptide (TPR) repeat protein
MMAGRSEEAIRIGRDALAIAEELGLHERRAHALNTLGMSQVDLGDPDGIRNLEQAVAIAVEHNSPEASRAYGNLAEAVSTYGGDLTRAFELRAEGLSVAQRFGLAHDSHFFRAELAVEHYWTGRWEESLKLADDLLSRAETGAPNYMDAMCWLMRARIGLARGDAEASRDAANALEIARLVKDPQVVYPALAFCARAMLEGGRAAEGASLASELLASWSERPETMLASHLQSFVDAAVVLSALGRGADLVEIAGNAKAQTKWIEGAKALVAGDFRRAAEIYEQAGSRPDEAFARLRAAEALIAEGNRPEGDRELQKAISFYRSVGATAYLREGETLLARTA